MNNHRKLIFLLILCALYVLYSVHKALAEPMPIPAPEMPICIAAAPTGIISLAQTDGDALELANAFTAHLDAQDGDSRVIKSIYIASLRSGVDFELLLLKAMLESNLGKFTTAQHSTARGVFQYIEPTWLVLIKRYGAQAGYARLAEAVAITKGTGIPYIRENHRHLKAEILALRHDTDAAALIKAYQIKEETEAIRNFKGGDDVTPADHYIAHMLGLSLALELYDLKSKNSVIAVAGLNRSDMREATRLNRTFFYDGKTALAAPQVYEKFENRVAHEYGKMRAVLKAQDTQACTTLPTRASFAPCPSTP